MGALGGVYTLVLISLLVGKGERPDYMPVFAGVAALMVLAVVLLVVTIREKKLAAQVARENLQEEPKEEQKADRTGKLDPAVKRSLGFILASIFLWFTAYNAVTTAFSRYAKTVWGMEGGGFANCLMVATVGAVLSYIPIGFISARVGRKRCIQGGLVLMLISFLAAVFFMSMDSDDAEAQPAVRFDAGAVNFTSISFQEALDMETCWSPGVQLGFEYDIRVKNRFPYFPERGVRTEHFVRSRI